jgi:nitrite reductase/ring-hydroxylating ferredoxin subunit
MLDCRLIDGPAQLPDSSSKKVMCMATRAPFLSTRYGGYYHREVPKEDADLTRIGPGTPCGEYLRRYWQPVTFSDDLKGLPVAVKILGEELVAFRDFSGRVGLVEAHCPHRGTSLEFGLVSKRGIRCCYNCWLFDVDGAILEMQESRKIAPTKTGSATAHIRRTSTTTLYLLMWGRQT